ncbi:hypothetical protein C1752_01795 [Acaryochloris thomasi RCC1774]|uniref:Pyridoxamine 5'-phosphate oxidase Alr4036 family FMN-binding domain-containing protein n=1 Tax=Acaryochloris thomasi RCC1774 TaxID=1764569 RepID=A0A2W1JW60_9CYAN|nr:pyridoxamine 5'-phosphate oxidase family protein [Acaryochloris thomasi]PZD73924.1 hypothetical protein C1752_01795 [Acaryochloris thomasi RCC1774]
MALKRHNGLDSLLTHVWDQICHGANHPGHPYHSPTFGSIGAGGPNLRTVVLRAVDVSARALLFHSDRRAPKIQEVDQDARVTWHFWHPEQREQLRLRGTATLHFEDAIANQLWQSSSPQSLKLYTKSQAPGTQVTAPQSGLPQHIEADTFSPEDLSVGRQYFAAIRTIIHAVDVLHLREEGNYRAFFEWENENVTSSWILP